MTFKVGDFIRVPKGTLVRDESDYNGVRTPSKRDVVVQVSNVVPALLTGHACEFLTEDQYDVYRQEWQYIRPTATGDMFYKK